MIDLQRLDARALAKVIDFSILPKETTAAEIREGCAVTRRYGFAAFYASSAYWAPLICEELAGMEDVEIGAGIAFPLGSAPPAVKAFEVADAVRRGCTAVDMVMNIGALKSGDRRAVAEELRLFRSAAGAAVTKCILEVCYLTDEQIATASKLVAEAGIDFVKTSSGQFEGPSLEQFLVMRDAVRDAVLSGDRRFFFGSDSAPHERRAKECADGCAGVYTAPVAIPLLAELFEQKFAPDASAGNESVAADGRPEWVTRLENFTSRFGAEFYGIPLPTDQILRKKSPWVIPAQFDGIVPFRAGSRLTWSVTA